MSCGETEGHHSPRAFFLEEYVDFPNETSDGRKKTIILSDRPTFTGTISDPLRVIRMSQRHGPLGKETRTQAAH